MLTTKTLASHGVGTYGNFTSLFFIISSSNVVIADTNYFLFYSFWYRWTNTSIMPRKLMVFLHMFRMTRSQLKVFYSVVCSYMVDMMNFLGFFKFSTKMLLHNISMFKNSFLPIKNTIIAIIIQVRYTFFQKSPVGRNIVSAMSAPPTIMHFTDKLSIFSRFFTILKCTKYIHISNFSTL